MSTANLRGRAALFICLVATINTALLTGHASSPVSHIVVGKVRPAIRSERVRIYIHPPTNFEEVAVLNSSIKRSSVVEDQKKTDKLIEALKEDAARLGANGVLINNLGDQYAGTSASAFLLGRVVLANENPNVYKSAAAMAIFVPGFEKVGIEEACADLASNDPDIVVRALKELRNTNSTAAVGQVLTCLKHSDEHVLRDACRTLAVIGGKESASAIEPLLKDRRTDVISDACKALAVIGSKESTPAIEDLLKDKRANIVGEACATLAVIGGKENIPAVEPLLRDQRTEVVCDACRTLGFIGNKDNIPAVEPLLNDRRTSVRKAARAAVEQLRNK
jgi:hypothetical protein